MLPSETMIWQPEFTDKTLSRKTGAVQPLEKIMPLLLREQYGVGPVCSELHIAPSTYYHCQQQRYHPYKRSACAQRDDWLKKEILRLYDENHQVYGGVKSDVSCYRKVSGWPDV
ncbi:TPA: hypothetical protein OC362_005273 [Escherichia coli]|nr:hypothetical protein [Escherichia coli]HCP2674333.1 hypothetical protein [Escherichia coli]